jgi:hypothetical protein
VRFEATDEDAYESESSQSIRHQTLFPSNGVSLRTHPVRKPRPSGEYARTLIPSSLQVSRTPLRSITSSQGEYSTSTKSILASLAARRRVSAEHCWLERRISQVVSKRYRGTAVYYLREADVLGLALFPQRIERADRLLDGTVSFASQHLMLRQLSRRHACGHNRLGNARLLVDAVQ